MNSAAKQRNIAVIERALLKVMYPGLHTNQIKHFYKFLQDKKISLINLDKFYPETDGVLCSVIRHQDTNYEQIVSHTEKYKARAILGPVINGKLERLKAGKCNLGEICLETGTPVKVITKVVPTIKPCNVVGHDPNYSAEAQEFKLGRINTAVGEKFTLRKVDATVGEDLTGRCFGRDMIVLGLSANHKGKWIVQCKCGNMELRNAKATKNPDNIVDCCVVCRRENG